SVQGVELDLNGIIGSIARGVPVIQSDLDHGLPEFPDDAFDFAVLSQTLQQVRQPKSLLIEMLRVARKALVVVPNFGFWRARLWLLLYGRAPVTQSLPFAWYDTPNLHFMSLLDFRDLIDALNVRVERVLPIIKNRAVDRAWAANLRAESALYVIERGDGKTTAGSEARGTTAPTPLSR
ncbi:MAG: methionine biosynthesis protein MetW, partial [Planctomycetaceae bacterium]